MLRHTLPGQWSLAGLLLASLLTPLAAQESPSGKQRVYIGTYNSPKSRGIYRCDFDLATGKLGEPSLAGEAINPSFLVVHPNKRFLFSVSEVSGPDGKTSGAVAAFAIDPSTGNLQALNQQSSGGAAPCHVSLDRPGTHLLVANYSGGNAGALPISPDGKLGKMSGFVQHTPSTVDPKHPKRPLGHSINLDAAGRFAFVADLGLDKVFIYRYDAQTGKLTPNDPPAGVVPPGSGPRHFAFHPNGRQAYVINETSLTVTGFDYDPQTGALKPTQTISTLPEGTAYDKSYSTAEVVVHPSGKFLYGSNRGHDTIAAFKINPENGQLTPVGHFAKGLIKVPRNFNIDPTGKYALVAGQDSDNVVVFRIDQETGALVPTGSSIEVGRPVCIKFVGI